jgi:hypothetical protein
LVHFEGPLSRLYTLHAGFLAACIGASASDLQLLWEHVCTMVWDDNIDQYGISAWAISP